MCPPVPFLIPLPDPPVRLRAETDEQRWARLHREVPTAFWLDPNLWTPERRGKVYDVQRQQWVAERV